MHADQRCTRSQFANMAEALVEGGTTGWRLRRVVGDFGVTAAYLEADMLLVRPCCPTMAVVLFIGYDECYALPRLFLRFGACEVASAMQLVMPRLTFLDVDASTVSSCGPLVSPLFHDELQMLVWSIHPCDTDRLLSYVALDDLKGNLLVRFIKAIASYVELPTSLVPL